MYLEEDEYCFLSRLQVSCSPCIADTGVRQEGEGWVHRLARCSLCCKVWMFNLECIGPQYPHCPMDLLLCVGVCQVETFPHEVHHIPLKHVPVFSFLAPVFIMVHQILYSCPGFHIIVPSK